VRSEVGEHAGSIVDGVHVRAPSCITWRTHTKNSDSCSTEMTMHMRRKREAVKAEI